MDSGLLFMVSYDVEIFSGSKLDKEIVWNACFSYLSLMRSIIIGFGLMILCLLVLFKIAEVNFIKGDVKLEVIVAIAAMVFFLLGCILTSATNISMHQQNLLFRLRVLQPWHPITNK